MVALLRGVNNIGTAKRIAMADLRALVERLGCRDVQTVRNSGNVVFSVSGNQRTAVAARLEKRLAARWGINSQVTLLSDKEVAAVVRDNPFANVAANPSDLLVVVPRTRADRIRVKPLLKQRWRPEALALGKRVVYLWCAKGVAGSALWPQVDRALAHSGTARNMATMTKLLDLINAEPLA